MIFFSLIWNAIIALIVAGNYVATVSAQWSTVFNLPASASGFYESPVIASSGVDHVMVMFSDRQNLYTTLSTNAGKTFPEVRQLAIMPEAQFAGDLAAGTTAASLGTFQACFIDASGRLNTAEYRGNLWYTYTNIPASTSVPQVTTVYSAVGCAVAEGSGGDKWTMMVMYHVSDVIGPSRIVAFVTRRLKSNIGTTAWDPYVKLTYLESAWPDFDKNWLNMIQAYQPKARCLNDGRCDYRFQVYNNYRQYSTQFHVGANDFRQGSTPGIPRYENLGAAMVQSDDKISMFNMVYNSQLGGYKLRCYYSYFEVARTGLFDNYQSFGCPDLFYTGPSNFVGQSWFFALDAVRHYDQATVMLSVSAMRVNATTGEVYLRETSVFESSDDCYNWGAKQTPFEGLMTNTNKQVYNTMAISRDGWLVGVVSGNQGKIMRKSHTLGNYKITSQADFTNSPTVAPTGIPTTLNPTAQPTVSTLVPTRQPTVEATRSPSAVHNSSTGTDAGSSANVPVISLDAKMIIVPGASAGFIAAIAVANAFAFIIRFGDDMRFFAPVGGK